MRFRFHFTIASSYGGYGLLGNVRDAIQALGETQRSRLSENELPDKFAIEVLWRSASDMEDYGTNWVPHRVIRWNRHSVLVGARPFLSESGSDASASRRRIQTYWLSRQELEQIGVARARSRNVVFFLGPHAAAEAIETVESIMRLGLWFPYSEQELRQAYIRRALLFHPDVGGNEEKFVQLQHDRELASEAVGTSWTVSTTASR